MPGWSRDEITLPSDLRAENAVITYGQVYPDQIMTLGLVPDDFHDRNHQRLWASMARTYMQSDETAPGTFYLQLIDELRSGNDRAKADRILESADATADWLAENDPGSPSRSIDYWVKQVRRCVVARKLIDAAAQIAERACRVPRDEFDATDACAVLSSVAGEPDVAVYGLEIPQ